MGGVVARPIDEGIASRRAGATSPRPCLCSTIGKESRGLRKTSTVQGASNCVDLERVETRMTCRQFQEGNSCLGQASCLPHERDVQVLVASNGHQWTFPHHGAHRPRARIVAPLFKWPPNPPPAVARLFRRSRLVPNEG